MIVYKCDICGCEIPKVKRKDFFGREVEEFNIGILKCEQLSIERDFLAKDFHMCKTCAAKQSRIIDTELTKFKEEVLSQCGDAMQDMRAKGMTYQEIGNKCGISKQRAHQLLNNNSKGD